jgi:hypothetical protein
MSGNYLGLLIDLARPFLVIIETFANLKKCVLSLHLNGAVALVFFDSDALDHLKMLPQILMSVNFAQLDFGLCY